MRKLIFIAGVLLLTSFKSDIPKPLKVELTQQDWGIVLQVIDQSNAPHAQVKAVQEILYKQLQAQIDTVK